MLRMRESHGESNKWKRGKDLRWKTSTLVDENSSDSNG